MGPTSTANVRRRIGVGLRPAWCTASAEEARNRLIHHVAKSSDTGVNAPVDAVLADECALDTVNLAQLVSEIQKGPLRDRVIIWDDDLIAPLLAEPDLGYHEPSFHRGTGMVRIIHLYFNQSIFFVFGKHKHLTVKLALGYYEC